MRLGITEYIDCAHFLPGHPKCGQVHGHTYRVDVVIEGESDKRRDDRGLQRPEARTREVLQKYDNRHWNDVLEFPTVENICELLSRQLQERIKFPLVIRVWEGQRQVGGDVRPVTAAEGARPPIACASR